jgi:H+/gluconate symporter-like permease
LDALGSTYMRLAAEYGIEPALMHRVAVIGSGTLDSLLHNGGVVTLLAVCGTTHRESYLDVVIVSPVIAFAVVIVQGLGLWIILKALSVCSEAEAKSRAALSKTA